jgi:glutamyl-tRNA synthetase
MNKPVRTRFAPSPTGYLHVGGIRTALFAWLLAHQQKGEFILRLEDTDKKREVSDSAEHLMKSLKALGLNYDEGPDVGGPYAPYRQSERLDSYKQWAQKLIEKGRAYADPYTSAEVQAFREKAQKDKQPFLFRSHRPENPPEWDGTTPLRFKSEPKAYSWRDEVMGDLSTGPEVVDDFILIKSDGYPTYNFAHIVDDLGMEISHIIRGQEFISSIPNYLNLYEALEVEPPVLATVPHIMGPGGNKKLSKRDGAKDILDYVRQGFLPAALRNFIASMGWNDGTEQEIFTTDELIEKFSLERIQHSGAHFDERRLLWMSGIYIREKTPTEELYKYSRGENFFELNYWPTEAEEYDDNYRQQILGVVKERLKYFAELPELTSFFFRELPVNRNLITEHKQLKKINDDELKKLLEQAQESLKKSDFDTKGLTERLNKLLEDTGQKPAVLFSLIRISITQAPASPGLADTLAVLGKERSLERITQQINSL